MKLYSITHSNLRLLMAAVAVMMAIAVWGQDVKISHLDKLKLMTSEELIQKGERYQCY